MTSNAIAAIHVLVLLLLGTAAMCGAVIFTAYQHRLALKIIVVVLGVVIVLFCGGIAYATYSAIPMTSIH